MCGIVGIIRRKNIISPNDKADVDKMLLITKHRGPDDSGVCGIGSGSLESKANASGLIEPCIGIMGFNRLSIQDLSVAGHQPMISTDNNTVITFNGEIYNTEYLRKKLIEDGYNYDFRGHSDTEVILACYMSYGFEKTVGLLNGMFSIVIFDKHCGKLYIARDRFGIIPCHLYINENKIIWTSENKAFLALRDFKRKVDSNSISAALKFCYVSDSLYKDVINVEPGTFYTYSLEFDRLTNNRYFDINNLCKNKEIISVDECIDIFRNVIRRQLISDAPVGVQLSGGIDSTLVARYVTDELEGSSKSIAGYSLINVEYPEYSEEKWINQVDDKIAINVRKIDYNKACFAECFESAVFGFERLVSIPSPIGIFAFSKKSKGESTVLLSGEGADEICGGYQDFSLIHIINNIPAGLVPTNKRRYNFQYKDIMASEFDSMLDNGSCKSIFDGFCIDNVVARRIKLIDRLDGSSFDRYRKLYIKEELVGLLERQNKICMANSVENRVPFLDNDFVDAMMALDTSVLLKGDILSGIVNKKITRLFQGKDILKRMSERIYGHEFAYRNKQAVRVPIRHYLNYSLFKEYLQSEIIPGIKRRGMLNYKAFDEAYNNLEKPINEIIAWKAINLEVWMQLFADGRKPYLL